MTFSCKRRSWRRLEVSWSRFSLYFAAARIGLDACRLSFRPCMAEEAPMFASALLDEAARLLESFRAAEKRLVTAESCTGGLITALLTEIPGSSDVVERGFVTYSNVAKQEILGVSAIVLAAHGAVSEAVARAMAERAQRREARRPRPSRSRPQAGCDAAP